MHHAREVSRALGCALSSSSTCKQPAGVGRSLLSRPDVHAVRRLIPVQELASGPPAGFELVETEGDTLLTLTKQQGGEVVRVDVMVNDQVGAVAVV